MYLWYDWQCEYSAYYILCFLQNISSTQNSIRKDWRIGMVAYKYSAVGPTLESCDCDVFSVSRPSRRRAATSPLAGKKHMHSLDKRKSVKVMKSQKCDKAFSEMNHAPHEWTKMMVASLFVWLQQTHVPHNFLIKHPDGNVEGSWRVGSWKEKEPPLIGRSSSFSRKLQMMERYAKTLTCKNILCTLALGSGTSCLLPWGTCFLSMMRWMVPMWFSAL